MNELLLRLIDTLSLPLEERSAKRALCDFAKTAGFDYYAYLHLRGQESTSISNYPNDWQERYIQKEYHRVDPVITNAKRGPSNFFWSAEEARKEGRKDVIRYFRDAEKYGICSGFSISVPVGFKDRVALTFASSSPCSRVDYEIDPIRAAVAATFLHYSMCKADCTTCPLKCRPQLSPREAECLRWFSEGVPMQEIAEMAGIGYRSVRSYLDEATRKLEAVNSRQAASIAIRLGLI